MCTPELSTSMLKDGHSAGFRPPFLPGPPPLTPLLPKSRLCQVDDELAKECSAPGGAGVLGALSRIVQRHGKAGLWRGMVPVLITMGVSNFVYFYCFNGMKVRCATVLLLRVYACTYRSTPIFGAIRTQNGPHARLCCCCILDLVLPLRIVAVVYRSTNKFRLRPLPCSI